VAYFETFKTLLIVSGVLFILSFLAYRPRWSGRKVFFLAGTALLLVASASSAQLLKGPNLLDFNTRYNRVWIYEMAQNRTDLPIRMMQVNNEYDSAMFLGRSGLVFDYTRYFRLLPHFCPNFKKVLMIGGAAYSYPKDYLEHFPNRSMDVVEIDPGITALAKRYFGLKDDPRLKIIHEDARVFLNQNTARYDAILGDAFKSWSVPYQLTTLQAVRRMNGALNSDGVVIMNIICGIEGTAGQFLRAEIATFRQVFGQVYLFAVEDRDDALRVQNLILVALKSKTVPKFYSPDYERHELLQHLWIKPIGGDVPVLTDAFAPTDRYTRGVATVTANSKVNPVVRRVQEFLLTWSGSGDRR
jgi:spermidine synthase